MVLFPQSQLLDLNRLAELTGRKLKAVPLPRLKQMLDKHHLKALPAIPLTSSPCLYEGSLLEPRPADPVGRAGLLLEINAKTSSAC
jgi:prolyl-tRNA editing enzyme YbaK/EbsC (Cys-tRNA(Pro) deacylase)